jgi:hypothetical protein
MEGKDVFKFLDLVNKIRSDREEYEKARKEAIEPKEIGRLQGRAEAYKDVEEKLTDLLRELNK